MSRCFFSDDIPADLQCIFLETPGRLINRSRQKDLRNVSCPVGMHRSEKNIKD